MRLKSDYQFLDGTGSEFFFLSFFLFFSFLFFSFVFCLGPSGSLRVPLSWISDADLWINNLHYHAPDNNLRPETWSDDMMARNSNGRRARTEPNRGRIGQLAIYDLLASISHDVATHCPDNVDPSRMLEHLHRPPVEYTSPAAPCTGINRIWPMKSEWQFQQ